MNLFGRRDKAADGLRRSREGWFGRLAGLLGREQMDEETWEQAEELLLGADVGTSATMALLDRVQDRIRTHSASPGGALETLKEEMRAVLANAGTLSLAAADGPPPWSSWSWASTARGRRPASQSWRRSTASRGNAWSWVRRTRSAPRPSSSFRPGASAWVRRWWPTSRAPTRAPSPMTHFRRPAPATPTCSSSTPPGVSTPSPTSWRRWTRVARVLSRLEPTAPHQTLLVMDATTGQNGVAQARAFTESVECTGIILAKLDGTARGGVVLAIGDQLRVPGALHRNGRRAGRPGALRRRRVRGGAVRGRSTGGPFLRRSAGSRRAQRTCRCRRRSDVVAEQVSTSPQTRGDL